MNLRQRIHALQQARLSDKAIAAILDIDHADVVYVSRDADYEVSAPGDTLSHVAVPAPWPDPVSKPDAAPFIYLEHGLNSSRLLVLVESTETWGESVTVVVDNLDVDDPNIVGIAPWLAGVNEPIAHIYALG